MASAPSGEARGTPTELDAFLKPVVGLTAVVLVLPVTVALMWFGAWWWLPVPTILAVVAYEGFFRSRGDRPTSLHYDADGLHLQDPIRGSDLQVKAEDVYLATVFWRRRSSGSQVVLMLASSTGPQFAVQLHLPTAAIPGRWDVDVDEIDERLGGQAGVLRAVAPLERTARQTFTDAGLLAWVQQRFESGALERSGLRVWRGEAPPLSPFGFHIGERDAWLVLEGTRWSLRDADGAPLDEGALSAITAAHVVRRAMLLVPTEEGPEEELTTIDGLALTLPSDEGDALRIRFPAPQVAQTLPTEAAAPSDLHTHAAEGAALVAHLCRVLDPDQLPDALRTPDP
ncbi:MAG: hypothetical protein KTR31_40345 [Myxococcales bacterium]|nr:hypothetical protein [Myxococcales bacterium]